MLVAPGLTLSTTQHLYSEGSNRGSKSFPGCSKFGHPGLYKTLSQTNKNKGRGWGEENQNSGWVWWLPPIIPALGRLKQEDQRVWYQSGLHTLVQASLSLSQNNKKQGQQDGWARKTFGAKYSQGRVVTPTSYPFSTHTLNKQKHQQLPKTTKKKNKKINKMSRNTH